MLAPPPLARFWLSLTLFDTLALILSIFWRLSLAVGTDGVVSLWSFVCVSSGGSPQLL